MAQNYFIEGLFILLGLAFIVTIVKYPKETLLKLPTGIFHHIIVRPIKSILLIPMWIIGIPLTYLGEKYKWKITPTITKLLDYGTDDDDKPHPSTQNLKIDFKNGDKYIFVISSTKDLKELIGDFIGVFTEKYAVDDFKINSKDTRTVIAFPDRISFHDFHLMVQHVNDELGEKKSFGIYKSEKLQYFVFRDSETLNNLVGFTSDKKLFSIHMLDDLETKQYLRLNKKLKVDTEWVERWNGAAANKI
ncbi:hypothetical protein [Chryseolinea sp. H1M3-3]|uniref:hypothetical protein n=1 Tax=Chryseolinea sp. H1M3-3 TaxID=3034144 RepID=UPI0023EB462D|nr:hypothetical protein [Chryseolinea sp. H1M3-3]